MDTFAYYGKRLLGFDEVMTDTLKNLNKIGKGQIIDNSYTFNNGVNVTLNGIMMDDNQLLAFYTIKSPKGYVDKIHLQTSYLEGLVGKHHIKNGNGNANESKTEIKWEMQFEKPYFFEKSLKWRFALVEDNKIENGEISFTIDKSKAMGYTLKKSLNKSIKIDQGEIKIDSISASPASTYIKGTIQDIFQFAESELKGEGFRPSGFSLKLIANGKTYVTITTMKGVLLSKVYMLVDGKIVDLKNTIEDQENKNSDGSITYTRTLCFEASGKTLKLEIKDMRYTKSYNRLIDIPIN